MTPKAEKAPITTRRQFLVAASAAAVATAGASTTIAAHGPLAPSQALRNLYAVCLEAKAAYERADAADEADRAAFEANPSADPEACDQKLAANEVEIDRRFGDWFDAEMAVLDSPIASFADALLVLTIAIGSKERCMSGSPTEDEFRELGVLRRVRAVIGGEA